MKYLTLHSLDGVLELLTYKEEEEQEEDEEEEEEGLHLGTRRNDQRGENTEYSRCLFVYLYVTLFPERLDDEIAAAVFENRNNQPDTDSITQLTSDNFHVEVAHGGLTVALFYLKCKPTFSGRAPLVCLCLVDFKRTELSVCPPPGDAVSTAFLSSFIQVAERLAGKQHVQLFVCLFKTRRRQRGK